ncbi:MAG: Dabb family protein [Ruminococcaceae bacterium]|nr:Dabb family protein [Oscillospiraceae bacterium]
MVKHMIVWKFKDELASKAERAAEIKTALEGLVGKIDGLLEMHILTEGLPCSSGDLMMDSSFESAEALAAYQKHPLHVGIADGLVRPSMASRLSFDYEV